MNYRSQHNGFTLSELVIVIAIVAIAATIAVPSLSSFVNQTKMNSVKTLLINDINTARSEAIKRNARITICAANATADNCASSTDWDINGWLICPSSGSTCDTAASAIVVRPKLSNGVNLASGSVNPIIFKSIGGAMTAESIAMTGKPGMQAGTVSIATTGFVSYVKN